MVLPDDVGYLLVDASVECSVVRNGDVLLVLVARMAGDVWQIEKSTEGDVALLGPGDCVHVPHEVGVVTNRVLRVWQKRSYNNS